MTFSVNFWLVLGLLFFFFPFNFLESNRRNWINIFCQHQLTQGLGASTVLLEGTFKTLLFPCFLNLSEYSTPAPSGDS